MKSLNEAWPVLLARGASLARGAYQAARASRAAKIGGTVAGAASAATLPGMMAHDTFIAQPRAQAQQAQQDKEWQAHQAQQSKEWQDHQAQQAIEQKKKDRRQAMVTSAGSSLGMAALGAGALGVRAIHRRIQDRRRKKEEEEDQQNGRIQG